MHPGLWEKLADTLFWLQLFWVVAGFLLMAYLALKIMPRDARPRISQSGSEPIPRRPELVVLGGYRFEVTQDAEETRPNVIELHPDQLDHRSRAR